jgi:hypothetical protein
VLDTLAKGEDGTVMLRDDGSGQRLFNENGNLYQYLAPKLEKEIRAKYKTEHPDEEMSEADYQARFNVRLNQEMMQFAYEDARIAEEDAFRMDWMGIRGFNDTTFTGWDSATKLYHTTEYRTGQGNVNRVGADIGNPRTIGILKAAVVPLYAATKTLDGDLMQDKIDRLSNRFLSQNFGETEDPRNINPEKSTEEEQVPFTSKEIARNFRFKLDELKVYHGNHFDRGVTEYKSYAGASEWNLDKVVTWDPFKGVVVDRAGLYKMFDEEFVKPGRYRVGGWGDLDYTKDIDNFEIVRDENGSIAHTVTDENGNARRFRVIHSKKQKIGEYMLGKQVYERDILGEHERPYYKIVNGEKVPDYEFANTDGRSLMWKEIAVLRMAAEVKAHRDSKDMAAYWDNHKVRMFFEALEKLPADIQVDENNNMNTRARGHAFTEEQMKYIRKLAGVEGWKLDRDDILIGGGGGAVVGLFSGFKKFLSESLK